ncbi:MAG: hypothetical protein OXH65_05635 [Paracoccaceae bacterium]|nr:hypothetical protein [Paracoccaceae bacterium]MDE2674573.1 hypothetical protein [Paracoccaceae bacterium]MDE2738794.1 hypothetical protein [Paracoccaceae bacterium]MXZ50683.1 hypothetical protein [Paracoccaceae bacterium]MYF46466.1 hypothetical protein [Paracoccaceae bacterium]
MSSKASKQPQASVDEIYQNLLEAFEAVDESQRMEFAIMVVISLCDQVRDNEKISEILNTCRQALEKED